MTTPLPGLPTGPVSGARAYRVAVAAGFVAVASKPHPVLTGEQHTTMEHPDGRRLLLITTTLAGSLVKATPLDREMWPDGVTLADSVPAVAALVRTTAT